MIRTAVRIEGYLTHMIAHARAEQRRAQVGAVRGLQTRPNGLLVLEAARANLRDQFDTKLYWVLQVRKENKKAMELGFIMNIYEYYVHSIPHNTMKY